MKSWISGNSRNTFFRIRSLMVSRSSGSFQLRTRDVPGFLPWSTPPPVLLAGKTSPGNSRVRPFSIHSLEPLRLRSLWVIKHNKHSGKVANKTNKTSRRTPHKERRWSEIVQFAQEHQLGRGSTLRARGTAPERMGINMVSLWWKRKRCFQRWWNSKWVAFRPF